MRERHRRGPKCWVVGPPLDGGVPIMAATPDVLLGKRWNRKGDSDD